jgi:hypothetical protein
LKDAELEETEIKKRSIMKIERKEKRKEKQSDKRGK